MNTSKIFRNNDRFRKLREVPHQKKGLTISQDMATESTFFGMNTEIAYRVFGGNAQKAAGCMMAEIIRLENKLSRFIPDSEIGRLNRSAGKGPVSISPETYQLLSSAIRYSKISHGLFNILAGSLIDLWNYKQAIDLPEEAKIRQALSLIDYQDLILDARKQTARLRRPGQSVDLGGIGKGFAGDCCVEALKKQGISSAVLNIGGNVSVLGTKPDGSSWRVGIRHPRKPGCLIGAVDVTEKAVVTSGDYERYFIDCEGRRRHHILNPATGYPAESRLVSVTVVSDSAMAADALSTAIFVAGIDPGLQYLEQSFEAEAILVDRDQQVFITQGLERCFHGAEGVKANVIGKEYANVKTC